VNYASPRGLISGGEVVKQIQAAGSKAALIHANIALLPDLKKLVEAALTVSTSGNIDILVHNAATGDDCYMEDMTEEFYESQTDVNLKGRVSLGYSGSTTDTLTAPIFLTQLTLPYIARGGRIVLVSSVSARMGMPQQTVYAGTKAALEGIAKVWATELGKKYGITVNCVSPGPVATDSRCSWSPYFLFQTFHDVIFPL
jgi:3-oxoacyl-[acyl-carrier protein] reductase